METFWEWGKDLSSFVAFVTAYILVLRPMLKNELSKDFDAKGTADSTTKSHRDEVHGIVARWELDRTLRREAVDERMRSQENRIVNLEEARDMLAKETRSTLGEIKEMLARIDERMKHIEDSQVRLTNANRRQGDK